MYNLPVKLSVLSRPYFSLSPQVFLDRSPQACLRIFKSLLPESERHALEFAFSDAAILLLLEHQIEVQVAHQRMVFLPKELMAQGWLIAHGYLDLPVLHGCETVLEELTEGIWEYASLFSTSTRQQERVTLRQELKALITLYALSRNIYHPDFLISLKSPYHLKRFFNVVVADAVFKADGARVLFGKTAHYTQLWVQKQHQFYQYARHVEHDYLRRLA